MNTNSLGRKIIQRTSIEADYPLDTEPATPESDGANVSKLRSSSNLNELTRDLYSKQNDIMRLAPKQLNVQLPSLGQLAMDIVTSPYYRRLFMGLSVVGFFFGMLVAIFGAGGWIDSWDDGTYVTHGSWMMIIANSLGFHINYHVGMYGFFMAVFSSVVFVVFWAKPSILYSVSKQIF